MVVFTFRFVRLKKLFTNVRFSSFAIGWGGFGPSLGAACLLVTQKEKSPSPLADC